MPKKDTIYDGPVVFCADGVHYPADADGHPVLARGLRATPDGGYRFAEDDEPLHNHVHGTSGELEIVPGSGGN